MAAFRQTPIRGHLNKVDQALYIRKARLQFANSVEIIFDETRDVSDTDVSSKFMVKLPAEGKMNLKTSFIDGSGKEICGAIVVQVLKVSAGRGKNRGRDPEKTHGPAIGN